ncbi:hypothetical protein DFJ58DRAFT_717213 [Suillus subalutaceus]|uniref:uncharacterized protein n=1 Tax=Suillus subalutaceus TaxID=48586 RepID=UPI001B87AA14|nr:uncharacterized protein DFJ58DRAFT_717213 [Suillus subalutaceus]KAG1847318.1 hypothetical protein DFJ58DRAFT_717213 [Suillus subalutaceus]
MAQKMRAAVSHKYGRDHKLGTQPWSGHTMVAGKHIGNPSLSVTISQYMVSHRRRKEYGLTSCKRKAENPAEWAGFVICTMLLLLYLVPMICLLRYDEALRITWADVRALLREHSSIAHDCTGIAPFYVYPDGECPWMCLVRMFAVWWVLARERCENLDGFVFRKKIGTDSISVNPTDGMTSDSFLECFRNNLLDIRVDPRPYGTHLFQWGGCQFLYKVCRWDFRDICDWGGWAENFDNPGTIFKYLLSWNNNPREQQEHYMNPNWPRKDPCHACGRTCHCA